MTLCVLMQISYMCVSYTVVLYCTYYTYYYITYYYNNRRCVLAVLDHFYRSAIYGESERPLAQLSTTGIAATPRGPSSARLKLTRRLSSSGAMIAAAPAGGATADKYATYIEQIPAEDGPGEFIN
jgi:hypothetical protein